MATLLLLGAGSPFGADVVGWQAVDWLASQLSVDEALELQFQRLEHPAQLHTLLPGADALLLIDALLGEPPGSLHQPTLEQLQAAERTSSHQLGVAESMTLAAAMGDLPERVELLGIGVASGETPPDAGLWRGPLLAAAERFIARCSSGLTPRLRSGS